jgi:hypothetical protein
MIEFYNRNKVQFLTIFLSLFLSCYSFSDEALSKCDYALENNESLEKTDLSLLEKKEVRFFGESSEGGSAEVYRKEGSLIAITTSFLGETGKTEIKYYFHEVNNNQYLVELIDYRYTTPIYDPSSKTASISINKFVVCEGKEPNYPNSVDLAGEYNRAINALANIRKSL